MKLEGIPLSYGNVIRLCGCAPRLGKAARHRDTAVARFVDRKAPRSAERVRGVLSRAARRAAEVIRAKYRPQVEKAAKDEDEKTNTIESLIAALGAEKLAEEMEGQMAGAMRDAFKQAAVTGLQQVGFATDRSIVQQMDEAARSYASRRGGELIKDLAGTTEGDMRRLIARGIEEGMSTDALADAVEAAGAFGEARAVMIARTELAFAHVQGNLQGWRASGEVVGKRSLLGDNHDIEDICDEAVERGVVGIDDEIVDGYDAPPYHPNCVCDIEPVLRESDDPGDE